MPFLPFNGKKPKVHPTAFVDPSVFLIGDVTVGKEASIWPYTVIRADSNSISIGANTNVQENSSLHTPRFSAMKIGPRVSIGHNAVVHGASIGSDCIIGMNATLLNESVIGKGCIIAAGAVVTERTRIPRQRVVAGVPAKQIRDATTKDEKRIERNWKEYVVLKEKYLVSRPMQDGIS